MKRKRERRPLETASPGDPGTIPALLERSFRVLEVRWPRLVEQLPGYAVGSLGAYWTIQRTLILLGGAR